MRWRMWYDRYQETPKKVLPGYVFKISCATQLLHGQTGDHNVLRKILFEERSLSRLFQHDANTDG